MNSENYAEINLCCRFHKESKLNNICWKFKVIDEVIAKSFHWCISKFMLTSTEILGQRSYGK